MNKDIITEIKSIDADRYGVQEKPHHCALESSKKIAVTIFSLITNTCSWNVVPMCLWSGGVGDDDFDSLSIATDNGENKINIIVTTDLVFIGVNDSCIRMSSYSPIINCVNFINSCITVVEEFNKRNTLLDLHALPDDFNDVEMLEKLICEDSDKFWELFRHKLTYHQ